jgi:hypothetical protein
MKTLIMLLLAILLQFSVVFAEEWNLHHHGADAIVVSPGKVSAYKWDRRQGKYILMWQRKTTNCHVTEEPVFEVDPNWAGEVKKKPLEI